MNFILISNSTSKKMYDSCLNKVNITIAINVIKFKDNLLLFVLFMINNWKINTLTSAKFLIDKQA